MICLPLNDPVIAQTQRTIDTNDIDEIEVCKISRKSNNVGPIIGPHRPLNQLLCIRIYNFEIAY